MKRTASLTWNFIGVILNDLSGIFTATAVVLTNILTHLIICHSCAIFSFIQVHIRTKITLRIRFSKGFRVGATVTIYKCDTSPKAVVIISSDNTS